MTSRNANTNSSAFESSCPAIDSGLWTTNGPISTPRPVREWDLENIQVNDSTVTVLLHVYAGIDVRATLDGREPEEVKPDLPVLEFVFENVAPGKHAVEIWDVVGHKRTTEVVVSMSGARPDENFEEVTLAELFANPGQFNGKDIILTGFYFHGAETIVLSERLDPTGFREHHLWPRGQMVWIEYDLMPKRIFDGLYKQDMTGPLERYGKLRIRGRFEHGERYGHGGGFSAQIVPSEVELLTWSPGS